MNIIKEISEYAKKHSLTNQFEMAAFYNIIKNEPFNKLFKNPKLEVLDSFAMIHFQEQYPDGKFHGSSVSFKHGHFSDDISYYKSYASQYHLDNLKKLKELISTEDLININRELNKNPDILFSWLPLLQEREKPFFQLTKKNNSEYYGMTNEVYGNFPLTEFRKSFIESINQYPLSYTTLFIDKNNNSIPTDFFLQIKKGGIENPIEVFKSKYHNDLLNDITDTNIPLHIFMDKAFSLIKEELIEKISLEHYATKPVTLLYEGLEEHIKIISNNVISKINTEYTVEQFISDSKYSLKEVDYLSQNALKFSDVEDENTSMNAIRYSNYYKDKNHYQENISIVFKSGHDVIAAANVIRNQDIYKKMPLNAIELSSFTIDKMYDQNKFFKELMEQVIDYANSEQKVLFISAPLNINQADILNKITNSNRHIEPLVIVEKFKSFVDDKLNRAIHIEYAREFKEILTSAKHSFSLHKSRHLYQQGLDYIENNRVENMKYSDIHQFVEKVIDNLDESKIPTFSSKKPKI